VSFTPKLQRFDRPIRGRLLRSFWFSGSRPSIKPSLPLPLKEKHPKTFCFLFSEFLNPVHSLKSLSGFVSSDSQFFSYSRIHTLFQSGPHGSSPNLVQHFSLSIGGQVSHNPLDMGPLYATPFPPMTHPLARHDTACISFGRVDLDQVSTRILIHLSLIDDLVPSLNIFLPNDRFRHFFFPFGAIRCSESSGYLNSRCSHFFLFPFASFSAFLSLWLRLQFLQQLIRGPLRGKAS